jgi:superfamily I DNA/RNA helicase/Zn-dependent peptidase ImmA (M78 family)
VENRPLPQLVAADLLRWLATTKPAAATPPVDVDALAKALGLDVEPFSPALLDAGALGYLEPGEDLIFLNPQLTEPVRRFTLAHEIGHAVLHRSVGSAAEVVRRLVGPSYAAGEIRPQQCAESDLEAPLDALDLDDERLHPEQAYSARSRRENEANAFAAALLMPKDHLLAAYLKRRGSRAVTARKLAKLFGVSEDTMLRQLTALLLPSQDAEFGTAGRGGHAALDASQRAAATVDAPALIVAGPGTGKTSTLVGRVAFLIRERGVVPSSILALTFSHKAAREMRERISALLEEDAQDDTWQGDPPAISTIHGFCGDLLRRYAPLVGLRPDFRLVTEAEGYFLLQRVCADLALDFYQPLTAPSQFFPDLLAAISRAKDELAGPADYMAAAERMAASATSEEEQTAAARAREVALVYEAYQRALEARGDPDFGDTVRLAVRLLAENQAVREAVRVERSHILVDEFQDINRAMGVLLLTLAGADGALWAVGDADQAIYRFRGASPANLARFTDDYPTGHVCRLERNYRSVPDILKAAAATAGTFLGGDERNPLTPNRATEDVPAIAIASAASEVDELGGLTAAIEAELENGRQPGEMAVLCRTRRTTQRVSAALRAANVPVRMVAPLLEQQETKDLLALPALLGEQGGAGLLRAGALPAHRFSREDALAVLRSAQAAGVAPARLLADTPHEMPGVSARGARGLRRLGHIVDELRRAPDVAIGLGRYLFSLTALGREVLAGIAQGDEAARTRAQQFAGLLALARAFEGHRRAAPRSRPAETHGADWGGFLQYLRVLMALRQGGGLDEALAGGVEGVAVLTVHQSKGLEFPIVFVPGLATNRFPVRRQWEAAPLPAMLRAAPGGEGAAEHIQMTEEACLFYVALTRAQQKLVLSYAERYGRARTSSTPSPFLAPIERQLGDRVRHLRWRAAPLPRVAAERENDGEVFDLTHDVEEPLNASALESYLRCPRQFAYRYVYGLRPREAALNAMRRGLHQTLDELRTHATERPSAAPELEARSFPSLEEAWALFERRWSDASGGEGAGADEDELIRALLRRHGQRMIEREWQAMSDALRSDRQGDVQHEIAYEQPVTVHACGRDIQLSLDRVERPRLPVHQGTRNASTAPARERAPGAPVRIVRQRMSKSAGRTDLRALLYALAAEQQAGGDRRAEVVDQLFTTGEETPTALSSRQEQRLREELGSALEGIESGRFPTRPEPHTCATCPFYLICPA